MQRDSLPCVLVPYPGHLSPHGGTAPLVHGDSSSKPSAFHEGQKLKLNHCMSSMSNHYKPVHHEVVAATELPNYSTTSDGQLSYLSH